MSSPRKSAVIAIGNYFFHYRNTVFPIIFIVSGLVLRPAIIGSQRMDHALVTAGVFVALAGSAIRLLTIGFDYIDRGGKNKQIHATFLAKRGMYALTRNPMYLGNALIAVGVIMTAGSPGMYLTVLPFFLFVYHAIVRAEEAYLSSRFGEVYAEYSARVPRWFPDLRKSKQAFAGLRYDWRRAVRKDLSTLAGLFIGLSLLPVWRVEFLDGFQSFKAVAPRAIAVVLAILVTYAVLHALKKRRIFFYIEESGVTGTLK